MKNFLFFLFFVTSKCFNDKNNELLQATINYECNISNLFDINFVPSLEIFFMDSVIDKYIAANFMLFANFKKSFYKFNLIVNGFVKIKNLNEFTFKNKLSAGIILSFHEIINEFINFDIYIDTDKNIKLYYVFNFKIKKKLKGSLKGNILYFCKKNMKEDIDSRNNINPTKLKVFNKLQNKSNVKSKKKENFKIEHYLKNTNLKLKQLKKDFIKLSKQIKKNKKHSKLQNDKKNIKKQFKIYNNYVLALKEKKETYNSNKYSKQEKIKRIAYINKQIKEIKNEVLFNMRIVVLNKI